MPRSLNPVITMPFTTKNNLVPDHTVSMKLADLNNGETFWLEFARFLGICVHYSLYVNEANDTAIIVTVPESGEYNSLQRFGKATHEFAAYDLKPYANGVERHRVITDIMDALLRFTSREVENEFGFSE